MRERCAVIYLVICIYCGCWVVRNASGQSRHASALGPCVVYQVMHLLELGCSAVQALVRKMPMRVQPPAQLAAVTSSLRSHEFKRVTACMHLPMRVQRPALLGRGISLLMNYCRSAGVLLPWARPSGQPKSSSLRFVGLQRVTACPAVHDHMGLPVGEKCTPIHYCHNSDQS